MKMIDKKTIAVIIVSILIGGAFGYFVSSSNNQDTDTSANQQIYTCSMHPQIRMNEPGKCPICGMELIPLVSGQNEQEARSVSMSPTAMQLANIQTMIVRSGEASKTIRLNGKVQPDERLLYTQSSHLPGRIEKLSVNFTGEYVKAGQIIATIYSPELISAQEELLEARKMKDSQPELFQAAKEKLKNLKLTPDQINDILVTGKTSDQFPILADVSGYVIKKSVNLGDYIQPGQAIYEIADLSKVWILFDVYESEILWIKKGDKVSYTIESLPGQTFSGVISFIDPVIDPKTRVTKARVEAANPSLKLKPEMFALGMIESKSGGKNAKITIPKTSVLWTGKRSLVYVQNITDQGVRFMMREVVLGPELGNAYIIESGLQEGEIIAVNGTFSIDAAAQLAGKPSMMNPEGGTSGTSHQHGNMTAGEMQANPIKIEGVNISELAKQSIKPVFSAYFEMQKSLSQDDFDHAKQAGLQLKKNIEGVDMSLFTGASHNLWKKFSAILKANMEQTDHQTTIEQLRKEFILVSKDMISLAKAFQPLSDTLYVQNCPMADSNKGANWLSKTASIENPYFGQSMFTCGSNIEILD